MKKKAELNLCLSRETLRSLDKVADPKLMAAHGGGTFMITIFCNPVDPASAGCNL